MSQPISRKDSNSENYAVIPNSGQIRNSQIKKVENVSKSQLATWTGRDLADGLKRSKLLRAFVFTVVTGVVTGLLVSSFPIWIAVAIIVSAVVLGAILGLALQTPGKGKQHILFELSALNRLRKDQNYNEIKYSPKVKEPTEIRTLRAQMTSLQSSLEQDHFNAALKPSIEQNINKIRAKIVEWENSIERVNDGCPVDENGESMLYLGALQNKAGKLFTDIGAVFSINEDFETKPFGPSLPPSSGDWKKMGIEHHQMVAKDHTLLNDEQLNEAADFIHEQIEKGNKVYIHCRAGVGRSAMAVAAYLIKYRGFTVIDACEAIKGSREASTIWNKFDRLNEFSRSFTNELVEKSADIKSYLDEHKELLADDKFNMPNVFHNILNQLERNDLDLGRNSVISFAAYLIQHQNFTDHEIHTFIKKSIPSISEKELKLEERRLKAFRNLSSRDSEKASQISYFKKKYGEDFDAKRAKKEKINLGKNPESYFEAYSDRSA